MPNVPEANDTAPRLAFPARTYRRRAAPTHGVQAAVGVAGSHGVHCDEPVVIADGYNLLVHLRPAPVVAKVVTLRARLRTPVDAWLSRELSVASFLAGQGVPVVAPSDELPPGPHRHDGLALAFFRYVRPSSEQAPAPATAGQMLAELHEALRRYPGELPVMGAPLHDIRRGLELIEDAGSIAAADLALLRESYQRVAALLAEPEGPVQPLHGDAHLCNLIATAGGPLWHDFEDTCAGPVEWDLASLSLAAEAALATYPDAPAPAALQPYREARMLHGAVCLLALPPVYTEHDAMAETLLAYFRLR